MGMYTWLYREEMEAYSSVSDKELDKVFQEVRGVISGVFISERTVSTGKFFWNKREETFYNIYHLTDSGIFEISEVRCLNLYLYNKDLVYNYLCGLYNGYHANLTQQKISLN